jgi:hypothetical protein
MRFSKKSLTDYLCDKLSTLESVYGFDYNNGTRQLKPEDQEQVINYGAYEALYTLLEDIQNGL